MFKRILVPLDGSVRAERAIPRAAHIARTSGGSVVLLRVAGIPVEYGPSLYASYVSQVPFLAQELLDAELAKARYYLAEIAQAEQLVGIKTETEVLSGAVAPTILEVAHAQQVDLIVMCSHGYTGLKRWVLGSVAQKIARHSPVPILVLREKEEVSSNDHLGSMRPVRVLVALDGSPLAEATLAPAAYLSKALSAPASGMLHLARVLPWPPMEDDGQSETITAARAWAESDAKAYLEQVERQLREGELAGFNLSISKSVAVHADVADTLMRMAEKGAYMDKADGDAGCDIITLATHGRGGLTHWAVGSIAERLLGTAKLPLLIVRPASEGSPVQKQSEANVIRM